MRPSLRIQTFLSSALLAAVLGLTANLATTKSAEARPSTQQFTCPALKQFINQRGAVVMDTKNNRVYKRFVKNRSFCELVQGTARFTVPTQSGTCRVKICRDINPGGGG